MAIEVFDTFDGTAGTLIPSHDINWSVTEIINSSTNTGKLSGLSSARGSNNDICGYAYSTVLSSSSCSVIGNFINRTSVATGLFRLALRITSGSTNTSGYAITWGDIAGGGTGGLTLTRFAPANSVVLGTYSTNIFPLLNVSHKIELKAMGSSIKVYVDDVQVLSATDSFVPNSGRVGFQLRQANDANNVGIHLLDITGESSTSEFIIVPSGGIVFSGTGNQIDFREPNHVIPTSGKITFSGLGNQANTSVPPYIINPSGGIVFSGTGNILNEKSPPHVILTSGGITFGGSAPMLFNYEPPIGGGPRMPLTGVGL